MSVESKYAQHIGHFTDYLQKTYGVKHTPSLTVETRDAYGWFTQKLNDWSWELRGRFVIESEPGDGASVIITDVELWSGKRHVENFLPMIPGNALGELEANIAAEVSRGQ